MAKLSKKHKKFVDEYLIDMNSRQAAIRAGYSEITAHVTGMRLRNRPDVISYLEERRLAREIRTEITQDQVLKEISRIAFSDPRNVMTWGAGGVVLKESALLTDDYAAIVSEVSETKGVAGGSMRLKMNDKMKALELLGRHLGMFKDKIEHTGKDGEPLAPPVINLGFANGGPGEPDTSAQGS